MRERSLSLAGQRGSMRIAAALGTVLAVLVAALFFSRAIEPLGMNIPQQDLAADYAVGFFLAVLLGASIFVWPVRTADKIPLFIVWSAKSIVTLAAMPFYEAHYDFLDAYSYFRVPQEYDFEWVGFAIGQGTENLYSLVWLYFQVMPQSYHGLKVVCAMIGLLGNYVFCRAGAMLLGKEDVRVLYVLALFPSILFWSSILGKEPFMLLGIAFYVYGAVGWVRRRAFRYLVAVGIGVVLAVFVRVWLGPILLLPLLYLLLRVARSGLEKGIAVLGVVSVGLLVAGKVAELFAVTSTEDLLTNVGTLSRLYPEAGGSGQRLPEGTDLTEPWHALAFLPLGMFTALFRPLPGEVLNAFGILAGIEGFVLLLLVWWAFLRVTVWDLRDPIVIWALVLVFLWAAMYGFMSYYNLGTAVRYRLQILPVLLGLLLYVGRKRLVPARLAM